MPWTTSLPASCALVSVLSVQSFRSTVPDAPLISVTNELFVAAETTDVFASVSPVRSSPAAPAAQSIEMSATSPSATVRAPEIVKLPNEVPGSTSIVLPNSIDPPLNVRSLKVLTVPPLSTTSTEPLPTSTSAFARLDALYAPLEFSAPPTVMSREPDIASVPVKSTLSVVDHPL